MNFPNYNLSAAEFNEILAAHLRGAGLPKEKFPRPFLLCPVGTLGSGKSTILKKLADKVPMAVVSTDDFRKILKGRGRCYAAAAALTLAAVLSLASRGFSVAVDTNCGHPEKKRELEKLASAVGAAIVWVLVSPPETFIIEKLKNFKHTWLFRDAEHALESYRRYQDLFRKEANPSDFIYTFDPSRSDFEAQITEAVSIILSSARGR